MPSLDPGYLWLEQFVRDFKARKLDDPLLKEQRSKLLRASLQGLPAMGHLIYHGNYPYGSRERFDFWKCVNCESIYPVINGHIRCNSVNITICPWCRHDSTPGRFGA